MPATPTTSSTSPAGASDLHEMVQDALDLVRPAVRDDGGDVELVDIEGSTVRIRFKGACIGCPSSDMTLKHGIERHLIRRVPGVEKVVAVES